MHDRVVTARNAIYSLARGIHSTTVEGLLKHFSGVPTMVSTILLILNFNAYTNCGLFQNAFSDRLGCDYNSSQMLAVDLLHEFELGIWKGMFSHLIRLLHAAGRGVDDYIVELDRRSVLIYCK